MWNVFDLVTLVGCLFLSVDTLAFSLLSTGATIKDALVGRRAITSSLMSTTSASSTKNYPHREFHRAVECATETGLCDVDELLQLADDLEKHGEECFFENERDGEACEKEKDDRVDVAGVLRLEAELLLRQDYLKNANLFKDDVEKARRRQSWEDHQGELDMYSNY